MKDLCQVLEAGENMTVSKYHFLHTDSFHLRRKTNLNKGMQCFNSSIHYLRQSKCTLPALSLKELVINLEIALKTNYPCLAWTTGILLGSPEFQFLLHDFHLNSAEILISVLKVYPLWLTTLFPKTADISLHYFRSSEFSTNSLGLKPLQLRVYCVSHSVVSDPLWPHGLWPLPGSPVHGILQARILEWLAIPFFRVSSQPRDWIQVSCITGRFFAIWDTKEAWIDIYTQPTLWNEESESRSVASDFLWPIDYTVRGVLQAKILEWVDFPFSRGPSQPRNRTGVCCTARGFFTNGAIREALDEESCI